MRWTDAKRLVLESAALIVLLALTWLVVGTALHGASASIVAAGRSGFTVLGLLGLSVWMGGQSSRAGRTLSVGAVGSDAWSGPTDGSAPRWWQLALLAATGVTAYTVLSTRAIELAGPTLPTMVISLTPAAVLLGEAILQRRRPPVSTTVGTAVAVAGALVFIWPQLEGSLGRDVAQGALVSLAAMLCMAFYGIYFARVNRGYSGLMARRLLPVFVLGALPLLAWASVEVAAGARISWSTLGLLAVLGIAIYVPVYVIQHRLLLATGASYPALLGLAVPPLVGVASAVLGLGVLPGAVQFGGLALTLLGMGAVIRNAQRSRTRTPTDT
jgi:drug/metabolite transporter (DMT)-like permease